MSNININILDVIPPSQAQTSKNILGTVNVQICAADGVPIARLNGLSVRKNNKDGTRFLAMPSYPVGKEGDTKYYPHFNLFPTKQGDEAFTKAQHDRMNAFTTEVLRVLDNGGTRKPASSGAQSAPAATTAPAKKEPWSV